MNKLKVVTVLGTRPEIIRLSVIIKKFDEFFDHTLVHTGQNYDYALNEIFFEELNIRKPDFFQKLLEKIQVKLWGMFYISHKSYVYTNTIVKFIQSYTAIINR